MSSFTEFAILAAAPDWSEYPEAVRSVLYFFVTGGFFMALIVLCSLLALTVIIWKALALRRQRIVPPRLERTLESADEGVFLRGDQRALAAEADSSKSVLGRIARAAVSSPFADKAEAAEAVQTRARSEVVRMETGVAMLEVVITVAPLLGLLGTVKGLVGVFSTLGAGGAGPTDPAGIALGIAEALNTTIAGLAVAIPTVVAHSYFSKKIERLAIRMESIVGHVLAVRFRSETRTPAAPIRRDPAAAV